MPGRRREEAVSHSRGRVKEASPAGAGSRQTTATAEPSLVAHQTGRGRNLAGIAPTKRAATVTSARKEDAPGSSRPEERRTPEGREERARGSNHQCVPKWRTKAVEWSNQRASPHGTSGTAAKRSPAADPCRTAPRARSAWTRKKSGTKTEDAHSWRQTAKAASIEAGTKSPPTLHEEEVRLKGQCRKKRRRKEDSSRKERERAAMGERSAMAGAWKEDEDRERTTRGWTPFGIIALLHTSATRP